MLSLGWKRRERGKGAEEDGYGFFLIEMNSSMNGLLFFFRLFFTATLARKSQNFTQGWDRGGQDKIKLNAIGLVRGWEKWKKFSFQRRGYTAKQHQFSRLRSKQHKEDSGVAVNVKEIKKKLLKMEHPKTAVEKKSYLQNKKKRKKKSNWRKKTCFVSVPYISLIPSSFLLISLIWKNILLLLLHIMLC